MSEIEKSNVSEILILNTFWFHFSLGTLRSHTKTYVSLLFKREVFLFSLEEKCIYSLSTGRIFFYVSLLFRKGMFHFCTEAIYFSSVHF